jgi:aminoglycoside/choline kinase family phosphotransferase
MDFQLKKFILVFLEQIGLGGSHLETCPIPADGSSRSFWRVTINKSRISFIVMANPPKDPVSFRENQAYLMIGKHLRNTGVTVPEIHTASLEKGWFIMEDMGRASLQQKVSSSGNNWLPLYEMVLEQLLRFQIDGFKGFDPEWCCQTRSYNLQVMLRYEAYYFKEAFLQKYMGLKNDFAELEGAFDYIAMTASKANNGFLLHRDFQSRNILILKGNAGIIDWQGARSGPLAYDAASLIIDPYVNLTIQERMKIYASYVSLLEGDDPDGRDSFEKYFFFLAAQRNLQMLGAFSHLAIALNKRHFEQYIQPALSTFKWLLDQIKTPLLVPLINLVKSLNVS